MFTIASDLGVLDLEVDIDEADVSHVAVGDPVTFTVEAAPDRMLDGSIRQVHSGPKITDGVTTYVAVIAVDNADLMLKPGMTATANIITDEATGVLTIANSALRFVPAGEAPPADQPHVYVLREGLPQLVPVTTGISDGQRTEITGGGIAAGDLVITATGGR
jgi:HlyD family secretion protein